MWNQPEEYFIEVVSNASMTDFPDNTLTKFTNKLPTPLELDGEWVVGIQEIFYPIDLEPEERQIQVQLFTSDKTEKQILNVSLNENDSPELIISKINEALHQLFNKVIDENNKDTDNRVKRSLDNAENRVQSTHQSEAVGELNIPLTLAEVNQITPEKMRDMDKNERINLYDRIAVGIPIILDKLYKEMEKYRNESLSKSTQIDKLHDRLKTFTEQLDEVKKAKLQEHQKYKTLKNDYDKKISDLHSVNTNIGDLQRKTSKLEQKLKLSEEKVKQTQEKANKLNDEYNEKERDLHQAKYSYANLIQEHTQKINLLENELQKKQNENNVNVDTLSGRYNTQIQQMQMEIDSLRNDQSKSQNEHKAILKKKNDEFDLLRIEIGTVKRQLSESQRESQMMKIDYQRELEDLNSKIDALKEEKKSLEKQIALKSRQIEEYEYEIKSLKSKEIDLTSRLNEQESMIKKRVAEIEAEKLEIESTRIKLENKENLLVKRLADLGIVQQKDVQSEKINQFMNTPGLAYDNGKIIFYPGRSHGKTYTPYFADIGFLNALGFDANSYLQMIDDFSKGVESFSTNKRCNLNLRSHLMFINSDIVAEHFVGNKAARVMRVLPIKRAKQYELVHEKFLKPFYYPVRANRIEDINFLLTDEMGQNIKFNSGRVLIGLHLKHV